LNLIHNTFQITSTLGGTLKGDVRMREGPPPRRAVVVVHGFKGFKDWAFFPHVCTHLATEGYAVVSFNFSHNGIGEDPEVFSDLDAFARNTLTREVEELGQIVGALAGGELTPTAPRRIGILGHSRGGAVSLLAAGEREEVASLVTWGAIDHVDRWGDETVREWREAGVMHVPNQRTGQHMPLSFSLWEDFQENRHRLDLARASESLGLPWLIVHGKEDLTVPVVEGERLARRSGTARLHLIEGAGHTFEATHPFGTPAPTLEEALGVTLRHFHGSLGEE
jgi:pimeloyl-ACP methyl ester carboxylesterase